MGAGYAGPISRSFRSCAARPSRAEPPLAKAASWTGMSGKACLTPSLLDCSMRPASTSSPDAPSVDPGEPERIRSSDRRQHRANTAFNFVLNQDYQRLSRSCRTERPPTQKTGRIPQRLERLAGSSRFQNESTADRVVLKVKIESFSKCRNQQTQALGRVVFKVSPQHHPKTQDLVGRGLMRAQHARDWAGHHENWSELETRRLTPSPCPGRPPRSWSSASPR
jgi:hypothetical protein